MLQVFEPTTKAFWETSKVLINNGSSSTSAFRLTLLHAFPDSQTLCFSPGQSIAMFSFCWLALKVSPVSLVILKKEIDQKLNN
jgi:hypothetical protein